jgi:two-component system chemotaxis sensor kinase CheA
MESLLDIFILENSQLIEHLEQTVLSTEKCQGIDGAVDEVFRIMHTIKGSASMMRYENIASLAHSIEDLFSHIRANGPGQFDNSRICDLVLSSIDFLKNEISKLENEQAADGDSFPYIQLIDEYLNQLQTSEVEPAGIDSISAPGGPRLEENESPAPSSQRSPRYRALLFFSPGCEMENLRAFGIVHRLKDLVAIEDYIPPDIAENSSSSEFIKQNGFDLVFSSPRALEELRNLFLKDPFVDSLELGILEEDSPAKAWVPNQEPLVAQVDEKSSGTGCQEAAAGSAGHLLNNRSNHISVNVHKLDLLMDMVGELVISQAMISLNPDMSLAAQLDGFQKASRQHSKIINELQDIVMSIRMVPLDMTFQKMHRIVRDMSKKLGKNVVLEISGEDTEVDKNIIDHLSDPLMHLIRNAIDHGIESPSERARLGKPAAARVRLEAKNESGDVYILVSDDGAGLDRDKILTRARERGLISQEERELSDAEIHSCILLPGFSTCEEVSEFSGRGVGMDVVASNIEGVGGAVTVSSTPGQGTTISLKIPLTLAIINGMQVRVGQSIYIIPITSIKESLKIRAENILHDPEGRELIMLRGQCYPVIRLYQHFRVKSDLKDLTEGIIIFVEHDSHSVCLFVDALLGEQQIVVKALPRYLGKIKGIGGCTLLGTGQASLILDVAGLIDQTA